MADLSNFPRPAQDTGWGIHGCPTPYAPVDVWLGPVAEMGFRWFKLLDDCGGSGLNNARLLRGCGIMPLTRLYRPELLPDGYSDVDLAVAIRYAQAGAPYMQLFCEPNNAYEWKPGTFWDNSAAGRIEVTARQWVRAAQAVTAQGCIATTPPLSPGGNHDDIDFFTGFVDWLLGNGFADLLLSGKVVVGCHNYTLNHPPDYAKDSNCFQKPLFYHNILADRLQAHGHIPTAAEDVPVVCLEGGTVVGNHDDATLPEVTVEMHRDWTLQQVRYMTTAPAWWFNCCFWLLCNARGGGHDQTWESQAWYSDRWPDGQLPAVDALRAEPKQTRQGGSMDYQERLRNYSDLWTRFGGGLNPNAAIAKEWIRLAEAGTFLGPPMLPEHQSENGRYAVQAFASDVLCWDSQTGAVTRGYPKN